MEQISSELKPGEVEPTKQELTKQLAIKWKTLSTPDKKVTLFIYGVTRFVQTIIVFCQKFCSKCICAIWW